MKTAGLVVGVGLIIVGAFFFISSVTVVNCQGSLAVEGVCQEWMRSVVFTFWVLGAVCFIVAVAVLILGNKRRSRAQPES